MTNERLKALIKKGHLQVRKNEHHNSKTRKRRNGNVSLVSQTTINHHVLSDDKKETTWYILRCEETDYVNVNRFLPLCRRVWLYETICLRYTYFSSSRNAP